MQILSPLFHMLMTASSDSTKHVKQTSEQHNLHQLVITSFEPLWLKK